MADVKVSDVIGSIEKVRFNPAAIQKLSLKVLDKVMDGTIQVVDARNPYVHALETSAYMCAAFMQQNEAATRRLYPATSTRLSELYLHMSDREYVDQHATASSAVFNILLSKSELLATLKPVAGSDHKKITIPRNTVFYAADIAFSLQYPVDIKQYNHGGIQISYVDDKISPLKTLSTNVIEWTELVNPDGVSFIQFSVEVDQFFVEQRTNDVNSVSGYTTEIPLTDKYCYIRCYVQQSDYSYKEIGVTLSPQIYDPSTATAVVRVLESKVEVTIPSIYTKTNLIAGKLRIDVYQTKGKLQVALGSYKPDDFTVDWLNLDENDDTIYTSPISNFKSLLAYSTSTVNGGSNGSSFQDIKSRVVRNTIGSSSDVITALQLEDKQAIKGYDIITNVDTITNRVFLASRAMPLPVQQSITSAASATILKLQFMLSSATNTRGVFDNGNRVTLSTDAIYLKTNGITKALTKQEYADLTGMSVSQMCQKLTTDEYFYCPFSYVLDATEPTFEVRAYNLDDPQITAKSFVSSNSTTGFQVSIDSQYSIEKDHLGYLITFTTKSSDNFKNLDNSSVQTLLSFYSENSKSRVYINAAQIARTATNERMYTVRLGSSFDIDKNNNLIITNALGLDSAVDVKLSLSPKCEVYFCTTAPKSSEWQYSQSDDELLHFNLVTGAYCVTVEKLHLMLGSRLSGLWTGSRSTPTPVVYQKYLTDVPDIYTSDVYEVDPLTGAAFTVDSSGNLQYNILHHAGEQKLNTDNTPIYKHRAGETILDEYGQPVIEPGYQRELVRLIDIFVVDAVYYFAIPLNWSDANNYRAQLNRTVSSWILDDIAELQKQLLDKSQVFFYPKTSIGDIEVLTDENKVVSIPANIGFTVNVLVTPLTHSNAALLAALRQTTITVINTALAATTVSVSGIEKMLIDGYGNDAISVKLSFMDSLESISAFTILNKNACSIRKRIVPLANAELSIEDDVTINFTKHGLE